MGDIQMRLRKQKMESRGAKPFSSFTSEKGRLQ
jgi:hypothetical protein